MRREGRRREGRRLAAPALRAQAWLRARAWLRAQAWLRARAWLRAQAWLRARAWLRAAGLVLLAALAALVALNAAALRVEAGPSGDAVGAPRAAAQEGGGSGAGLLETELERQAESLGLDSVDRFLEELDRQMAGDLPPLRVRDVISMVVRGEGAYTLPGFLRALGARLMREVLAGSGLLARLVILSLVAGLLKAIQSAFARSETAELAYGACYLVLIIMAMGGFLLAMEVCRGVIDNLTGFMQAMLPVMILLLAGVGAVSTAGLLNPVLVASVQFIAGFIRDVALPVVLCAACVDLVSRTFTRVKATALADLLRQGAVVVTGLLLSLFTGVVAVYGAAGSVVDGAAIKAAKFATATFIPFLGGFLADAVEVVISSSLVLKNVVGVVGALGVVAFTVFPLLKVLALVLVFRVAGALVQPLGAGELVGSLNSVGSSLVLMMVMACAVAVMFLITLAVVVMAATAAVMIR